MSRIIKIKELEYGRTLSKRWQVIAYANVHLKDPQDFEGGGLAPTSYAQTNLGLLKKLNYTK